MTENNATGAPTEAEPSAEDARTKELCEAFLQAINDAVTVFRVGMQAEASRFIFLVSQLMRVYLPHSNEECAKHLAALEQFIRDSGVDIPLAKLIDLPALVAKANADPKLQPGETLVWLARDSAERESLLEFSLKAWIYAVRPEWVGDGYSHFEGHLGGIEITNDSPIQLAHGECKAFAIREVV